ncbi:MAG: hypothetical protein M5R40_26975 [Anaerolineae bacterium]|nr:hypothetical protein [Anaerolineae bacterium]
MTTPNARTSSSNTSTARGSKPKAAAQITAMLVSSASTNAPPSATRGDRVGSARATIAPSASVTAMKTSASARVILRPVVGFFCAYLRGIVSRAGGNRLRRETIPYIGEKAQGEANP